MASRGRSLELFYVDGRPGGMVTAEMFNWTGHLLLVPRTDLARAFERPETRHTGVYILAGEDEAGAPRAYIGEAEDIAQRIKSHDAKRDWWSEAVLVTAKANDLNKAHVRYLEARLCEKARKVGRTPLENGNIPSRPGLSEADTAKMEEFFDNLLTVLPALRVDMFVARTRPDMSEYMIIPGYERPMSEQHVFELTSRTHQLSAKAIWSDGEFIVQKGSLARLAWEGEGSAETTYGRLHDELRRNGVLELSEEDGCSRFTENYVFNSVSAAAAVIYGRPANGTIAWKHASSGKTYKDWENDRLIEELVG